jgi:hypothetical protein
MNDLARLGLGLNAAVSAAESQGCLPRALMALTPLAFVGLHFAGRELLLLALDAELETAARKRGE